MWLEIVTVVKSLWSWPMIKVILTLNILCVINHVIEEKRCFEIFIWNSGFSSSEVWNFVFTFSLLQWNSEISLMTRGHWEYEPIRDIIEKPSFEKRKCKKHLVRGRRSLNVSWRISASHRNSCSHDITGLKKPDSLRKRNLCKKGPPSFQEDQFARPLLKHH